MIDLLLADHRGIFKRRTI